MKPPLWLPVGSVRALIAIGILAIIAYLAIVQRNEAAIGGILGGAKVVWDYFSSRPDPAPPAPPSA
jgi:hypothetical protein